MLKNQKLIFLGLMIFTATIAAVCIYGINKFANLKSQELRAQINFQCAQNYRYSQTKSDGSSVSYPMQKEYEDCVKNTASAN